ncbi:reverse transcriptase [Tanacetum coccineum]
MVVATRNTNVGNNPAEEESVRDILLRLFTNVDNVDDNVKVKLASIHLYDKALAWHKQFEKVNGEFASWELYETTIYKRFGPCYEDPMEEIKNLRQEGTVSDYQDKFEALISRVELTESQAISCFLAGLQQDIGLFVKMIRPKTLYYAYQLARMQETVRSVNTKRYTPILPTPKHSVNTVTTNRTTTYNARPPTTQLALPFTHFNKSMFSIEVLGEDEMPDSVEELEEQVTEEVVAEPVIYPYISLNALAGVNTFHTMRIKGHVGKQDIHILVDSGSTHNFVDVLCAKRLGCEIRSICPLQVEVPGGNQMLSTSTCRQFAWSLQDQIFKSDVMMEFTFQGKKITLRGNQQATLHWINGKDYGNFLSSNKVSLLAMSLCVYLSTIMTVALSNEKEHHSTEDSQALAKGVPLVNIRPYKHPPTQNDAIELMVKELLETGVIRNSHSPFSLPIVMVNKKDGTWRMCIDYRQLNKHKIKDKFPIPVIEELIDELHGAQVFSKLDLRSGYHQIRMADEDVHKTAFRTHEGHYEHFVLVFFDDILIYSDSMALHLQHLAAVLQLMRVHALFAKQRKCVFAVNQVEYLGHVISAKGVATDSSKIEAMKSWPAFEQLKQAMIQTPVLALPNFDAEFVIETDTLGIGLGVVLQQCGHPIAYLRADNAAAYALSRLTTSGEFNAMVLSSIEPDLLKDIKAIWIADVDIQLLIQQLETSFVPNRKFNWSNGELRRKGKLVIGNNDALRTKLVTLFHSDHVGGHPGIQVSLKKLAPMFYWKGMSKAVKMFIRECDEKNQRNGLNGCHLQNIGTIPTSIKTNPFEIVYGQPPTFHISYVLGTSNVYKVDRTLSAREEAINVLKFYLRRAQDRMKAVADGHGSDRTYAVGDMIYLKLQPYKQITVRQGVHHKTKEIAMGVFPTCTDDGLLAIEPYKILDRRLQKRGNAATVFVLMQQANSTPDDATWEWVEDLQKRFPQFKLDA